MLQLSSAGQHTLSGVAQRHGFSLDAVTSMFEAVLQGQGSMAQFNHPEFGGSGQWMSGGMTMLSDMFNNHLKGRVDNLCAELSGLSTQDALQVASPLLAPAGPDWWGPELRWPNSTGSQNHVRYAYFAQACRLATEINGTVTVYDTLDHQIGGFSQQQSGGASFGFTSQYGAVDVSRLPVVSVNGTRPAPAVSSPFPMAPTPQAAWIEPPVTRSDWGNGSPVNCASTQESDIFASIERLASLHAKGILTDQEYQAKKAELLARL